MDGLFVLDTGALLGTWTEARQDAQFLTTHSVIEELHNRPSRTRAQRLIDIDRLSIQDPLPEYLKKARTAACKTGDLTVLSDADVELLALGIWKDDQGSDVSIVSSDFALLNTAKSIGLSVEEIGKRMTHQIKWMLHCPGCGHQSSLSASRQCPVCGTEMKRIPRDRERI